MSSSRSTKVEATTGTFLADVARRAGKLACSPGALTW